MPLWTRRQAVLSSAGAALFAGTRRASAATQTPITIVINQSPWLNGFRKTVELYQKQTGNKVSLDVNPFAGSLEKQRTAVRSGVSPFDILVINAGFFVEMYVGGFLQPLDTIQPGFKLDPAVYTFDGSPWWNPETKRIGPENGGVLLTVPINPYIPLLHYRGDLYKSKGLKTPRDLGRAARQCPCAEQPAAHVWHRPAR